MKESYILLGAVIACCFLASCAPFPKHVSAKLTGPQPRNPFVTAGTDSAGMIVWNHPVLNDPLPSPTLATKSIEKCGGVLGKLFAEWQNVDGKQLQFIHGTAAASEFSGYDFWGTHRYHDWNVLLVANQGYDTFLAPANVVSFGGWDDDAVAQDLILKNPNLDSLVEVEWDSGFFAPEMAPLAGDETVAVGRWAFDCGHEDQETGASARTIGFRSEIHAPEILLSSHLLQSDSTMVHAQFKIFAGSRSGPLDTIPFIFFLQRFFSSYKNPLGGQDYSVGLRAPGDGWTITSCSMTQGKGTGGRTRRIKGHVESGDGGKSLTFTLSVQGLKPTARIESSTIIDVSWVRADSSLGGGVTKCE
jgi:hypothetical protein